MNKIAEKIYEKVKPYGRLIYLISTGAQMYGTVTPESDVDYAGIFIPKEDYILGIKNVEQLELHEKKDDHKDCQDCTVYALPKFIKLALGNNPNIIELFMAPQNCILYSDDYGYHLKDSYKLFISKKCYATFKGYAASQRKKLIEGKSVGVIRSKLIEKFGFDCKFMSHLLRLLIEGHEILVSGKLQMPLIQNKLVLDTKLGKHSFEDGMKKAAELEMLIDLAYTTSNLRIDPDYEAVNKLQIQILKDGIS